MKRISVFGLFMTLLLGLGFQASALKVTFEWDIPGSVKIQLDSSVGPFVNLAPDQTSYTLETTGWCYIYGADGYIVTGAKASDGSTLTQVRNGNGICVGEYFGSSRDGQTYKVEVEKVVRNDSFTVNVVNGANYLTAKFSSGYILDLKDGIHTYKFNPDIDGTMTLSLSELSTAYKVTLNGTEVAKNHFYPKYEDIKIQPDDVLTIQVFEGAEPLDCKLTFDYGEGMEGCVMNIYNRSTGNFIYPAEIVDNFLVVKIDSELRINFVENDYTFTKILLNGEDITSSLANNSITVNVTDENTILRIEGKAKEYADINFIGYIINGEDVNFSLTYGGEPFAIAAGEVVANDIVVDPNLTMAAARTKKYVIPVSEKNGKFFFAPKTGYYITNVFTLTPEGSIEQHSGNSSISANIDGTTFYMIVEKLPEAYKAKLNIKGEDFYLRITPNSTLSDNWGNPAVSTYSSAVGEREISFLPGYTTPIVFGFVGDETRQPALYLDGAEMTGTVNNDSGAIEYFVTPYSPESGSAGNAGLQSTIDVYNSFSERPTLSGASLVVEEGAEAEFFYSPVLHEANPAGQVVISGTQFTVKPANRRMIVTYKNEAVKLNANGEFVFNATGNARNNVVKVSPAPPVDPDTYLIYPEDGTTVDNLSSISITFPEVKEVEYNEIPVTLVGPETNLSSIDVHGNANEWTVGFHNPAISGEYTVTFPEGAFTLDGKPSLETKAVYTFKTGWELLPAPGSKVENLDEIILSFPEAKEVQFVGQTYSFTLMQGNSYASPGMNCRKVDGASVPTFSITLVEGAMAPPIGLITFIIDEGAFTIDGNPSAEIFVDYTIDRESSTDYLVTPENVIIYQDYGYDFAFIFEESTNVTGTLDQSKVHIAFDGAALASSDYMSMAEANMLMFQITNAAYIKAGHLKVEIEAGAFMLGKTPSPSISAEWDVVAPRTFNVEVIAKDQDESGKVNDLSEIYILFPEAKTGEVYMASGAQLRSRDYSYSQSAEIRIDETAEKGVKAILSFNPAPEKETEYVLYVHTGAITLDGSFASPEIEKTFIFDKQSGMVALYGDANGNVTVLSIDGKVILLNVPAERIRELENGLYIVNGKKTIVK